MFCAECGTEINDKAVICPKCGVAVAREDVPNHLIGSILATIFCCQIGGIVAIVYAVKVNSRLAKGDVVGAKEASNCAKKWMIASVIIGVIISIIYFILGLCGALAKNGAM